MKYRFGNFVLDTELLELRSAGTLVTMEPQVFSLLVALIENRERVVGKDELIDSVWGGRIVSDATLNSRINAARRAVGDNGKDQAVIRTHARRGFRFVAPVEPLAATPAAAMRTDAAPALQDKPSVAVLPFVNMSDDPSQDYFADGISEDIIVALSRMRWLFVIARNSSFAFKGRTVTIDGVARELGVRYVVEGSVRKSTDRVRITGQLVDAADRHQIWAQKYDGSLSDIFSLQDEITSAVAMTLSSEITMAEIERARAKRPENFDAWDRYLHALPLMHRFEPEANARAKITLEEAIEADPEFVPPHVGLAWCYAQEALHGWQKFGRRSLELALHHARAAIALDPNDPRAHCSLALAHLWLGEQDEAIAAALRSIALDANMPEAHGVLGCALSVSGQAVQAIESIERALRGSPRDPVRWFWYHGMANAHFSLEHYDDAINWAKATAELMPGWAFSYLIAAASAGLTGKRGEAERALSGLLAVIPHYTIGRFRRNPIWTEPRDIEHIVTGLRNAGLAE